MWVHYQTVSCYFSALNGAITTVGSSSLLDMNAFRVWDEGPLWGIHLTSLWLYRSVSLCHAHFSFFLCCPLWRGCPPLICFCWSPLLLCEESLLKTVYTLLYLPGPSIKGFLQMANIDCPYSPHCFVLCVCVYGMFDRSRSDMRQTI